MLMYPYSFEERRVCLLDKVLFVPVDLEHYAPIEFPVLKTPIFVEYCSGNGEWICTQAKLRPDVTWFAVERRLDRVQKIHKRVKREEIDNVIICFGEAETITRHYFQDAWADEIFVNFPDPWPKRRHAKNRLIQRDFLSDMRRVLKGNLTFVTDDVRYRDEVHGEFAAHEGFREVFIGTELEGYGTSYFEQLWRSKGKTIYYQKYV